MMAPTLDEMLDAARSFATGAYEEGVDELYCTVVGFAPEAREFITLILPFDNQSDMRSMRFGAALVLQDRGCTVYVVFTEAWRRTSTDDFAARTEVIGMVAADTAGNVKHRTYEIIRGEAGTVCDLRELEMASSDWKRTGWHCLLGPLEKLSA